METQSATPEVTDISFLKDVVIGKEDTPATPITPEGSGKAIPDPNAEPEAKVDSTKVDSTKTPAASTKADPVDPSKQISNEGPQDPIDLSDEDLNDIISQASGGKLQSYAELNEKLARLEELEKNPSALFNDPHKRQIFEFLNKYQGQDYETGLQNYGRLSKMDLESIDAETALKEVHMIENLARGMTRERVEALWEFEKAEKYDSKGAIGEDLKTRDAFDAKKKLAELKEAATTPKVDSQQEQLQAKNQEYREAYLSQVEQTINNEQGQFKSLKISFSENPEEDLNYEVKNPTPIYDSLRNFGDFLNQRYGTEGKYDAEQMKVDLTNILESENMLQQAFEHGVKIGDERNMRKRTNTPDTGKAASNAADTSGIPKTLQESLLEKIR